MSIIRSRGYTLVELTVAVGLFALIMTLVSGAYIVMIGLIQREQGVATGIDNLSFALETMTRNIRTGTNYNCGGSGDCPNGASSFSFLNTSGTPVSFSLVGSTIQETNNGISSTITEPAVHVSSLMFYVSGTAAASGGDYTQPHVTIIISGTVSSGSGETESFTVETGATMRGPDL
ncbi:MAG: prepilin-type N-terminal cleavage/methylation domain-containing protein [bacterium]|nr:prepilin-type N-terminal cleavage/methylation domain-containing protein [bacterium]